MKKFYIFSKTEDMFADDPIIRQWQADNKDHAEEQHKDAFPEEEVLYITESISIHIAKFRYHSAFA